MRILIITHEYPPIGGGGANACYYISKELAKLGHMVTILTASYKTELSEESADNVRIIRVTACRKCKEKSSFFEMLTFVYSAWIKANMLVREEKFDVCQVFFGIPSGPLALYLKKRWEIPYVVRFGGGDIPGTQKRFYIIYKMLAPVIRSIWKNADFLVANSHGLKTRAEKFEKDYPIQVICNGVDTEYFRPRQNKSRGKEETCNILFVSRLLESKGLQNIIPSIPEIAQRSCCKINLTVVGEGPYRKNLEKLVSNMQLEQSVSFAGHIKKESILQYYHNADIFILPSESEGMPNVVLEAMAVGLPVVMTPCEGSQELIEGNGAIVSIDEFSDKLIEIVNNYELRIKWEKCARDRAVEQFKWSSVARQYEKLYQRCLQGEKTCAEYVDI